MIVWNSFQNDARVLKEAQTLARAGFDVTVYALRDSVDMPKVECVESRLTVLRFGRVLPKVSAATRIDNVSPLRLGIFRSLAMLVKLSSEGASRILVQAKMLVSLVKRQPEYVHSHDVDTLPLAWLAGRLIRGKLIYDAHEISVSREGYRDIGRFVGCIEKWLMPRADACITTTSMRAKFFARAYSVPRPIVLENRPRFTKIIKNEKIRRTLGLKEPFPIVLYQGGLQPGRGLETLVRAFKDVPTAYLVCIGGGSIGERLKEIVKTESIYDRVFFIPTVPLVDLPEYTASADIGVQPIENTCLNHYTTDSNKLFEYIVAGLPVVASNLPEIARIVRENDLGRVVKSGSAEELASALALLVNDKAKREYYASRARQAARELNWESQESRLEGCYGSFSSCSGDIVG
ncbi:glycosyltransferase family 4 protein [Microbulbifer magnicolonia]|uniref:glycosyltransferase family 4 protein n=1 Tax=Microbulbifer magnicolonia TaxID=3109744 RepID=UPI002B417E62|nr:glycosyltransferase family 4 protein [Microbulbifer sp. GG15]